MANFVLRPRYSFSMNVLEAARARIRWLWDEFDGRITVNNSGGKDSTVVLELAAEVARERGEKLHVAWLDQECEFEATVDYQRYIYQREDIDFDWYQIPFMIDNSTNMQDKWLYAWDEAPGIEWVREKEPYTIHENPFVDAKGNRVEIFYDILDQINKRSTGAILSGMRIEESPARYTTLLRNPAYKWATWSVNRGKIGVDGKPYHVFSPIYDWSYRDIWKFINDNGIRYNSYYDLQFQHGVPIMKMRVSNYHHEQALASLNWLQEVEPDTWERATKRLQGISTQGHIGGYHELLPETLPYMFKDWADYQEHLIANLIPIEGDREIFRKQSGQMASALPWADRDWIARAVCRSVLKYDVYGQYIGNAILTEKNARGRAEYTERTQTVKAGS